MPSVLSKTWLEWFGSRESGDVINKQSQEKLFETFNHAISQDKTLDSIILHDETVFIHKSCVGLKKLALFHHLVKVGGSIYDSNGVKFGVFYGLGENTTFPMIPDVDTLTKESSGNSIPVPTQGNLFGVANVDDIDALATSASAEPQPQPF